MKTTLDLPDKLLQEVKSRARHEGKNLKEAVANLLRQGLAATAARSPTVVKVDKAMLKRREEITQKFINGEWGVELAGFEEARAADRAAAKEHASRWRE